jgi:fatty acid desaturase
VRSRTTSGGRRLYGSLRTEEKGIEMANMNVTDRTQYERADVGDSRSTRLLTARSSKGPAIYTLLCLPLLAVLIWSVLAGIQGWWHWLILGVIFMTTIGLAIAISPNRRGA